MKIKDFVYLYNNNTFSLDELIRTKEIPEEIAISIFSKENIEILQGSENIEVKNIDELIYNTDISTKTIGHIEFVPIFTAENGNVIFGIIEDIYQLQFNKKNIICFEEESGFDLLVIPNDCTFIEFLSYYFYIFMRKERCHEISNSDLLRLSQQLNIEVNHPFLKILF